MRDRAGGKQWLWGATAAIGAFYWALARRTDWRDVIACAPEDVARSEAQPDGHAARAPLVTIVVPARNEARSVRDCVASLLDQDYPHVEVIVVDDASSDATPRILDELGRQHLHRDRLRVLRIEELPAGWAGKPHALHVGAAAARGDWLVFTDADTWHAPAALRSAMRCALAERADMLSLVTRQDLPDFWGRVLMPIALMGISALYPARQVQDPASAVAIANGQYILIRHAVYMALGGYGSQRLRTSLVDDRDLAREVKRAGYRLTLADGRRLVTTRMYRSLGEHWRGWGKNVYAGSRGGPLAFGVMTLGLLGICLLPAALLVVGLVGRRRPWAVAGALQLAATVGYRYRVDRALDVPWAYAWTHPLGGVVFSAILARAGWRRLTGRGVEWSGRTYLDAPGKSR
jgi:chlorobactene glucosyltransferase